MPTYLYCLLRDRVDPPRALAGVGDAPVRALDVGPLCAWVETVGAAPTATSASLQRHDNVTTEALRIGVTPLPVRFGEVFESDDACAANLTTRSREFLARLEAVEGRVEMTIAITLDPMAPASEGQPVGSEAVSPGRAYLERLRLERQGSQILQQQGHVLSRPVINAVRHLVSDERAAVRPTPPTYLISHLIHRGAVDEYLRLARLAVGGHADSGGPRAIVRGPSAPYSFASVDR